MENPVSPVAFPFTTFIVKVVSRCNLNCSYCFEFNKADQSWKAAPKVMSADTVRMTARRIAEFTRAHGLNRINITAHGGEPLMYGPSRLDSFLATMRQEIPRDVTIGFGAQTNAVLVDDEVLEVLYRHRVSVGVSLDGPPHANRHRVDHAGRSSYEKTVRGIELLRSYRDGRLFAGLLSAVDLETDPIELLQHHAAFQPRQIDLLQQFGTHDNPPPGINQGTGGTPFADWMLRAFRYWVTSSELQKIRIRIFEDAMSLFLGGKSSSEWFGNVPLSFVIVATDGSIEGSDSLKIVGQAGRVLGLNIEHNTFDDALASPEIRARQAGKEGLCQTCRQCPLVDVCGGGYHPTRFRSDTGYLNPSVYCDDLKVMLEGIRDFISDNLGDPPISTRASAPFLPSDRVVDPAFAGI